MTKILIRGTKSPFEAVSAERMLRDNLIANNSGNLLFLETAWKILSTKGTEITPDRLSAHRLGADRINERFDHYVIPLANAFRRSYMDSLSRLTRVIERLTIPVTVLGVGVQFARSHEPGAVRPFDDAVKAFARAVLDRSPSIGVRGETTQEYLRELGFRGRRGDRLSLDVPPRRADGGQQADADPRPGCAHRHGHHADRPGDGPHRHGERRRATPTSTTSPRTSTRCGCCCGARVRSKQATGTGYRSTCRIHCCATTSPSSSWIPGRGSTTCARPTSCSGRGSTAASRPSWRGRRATCSPTTRGRSSWPATSTSRTAPWRTRRPTSTPPTCTPRPISGR